MANTVLTADIIAAEAIDILENNCVMGDLVYRGYEEEFNNKVNGYSVGDTISVRRPTDFTVRDGATASIQDAVEGKFSLAVDKQKGVDFKFTSSDLTLRIDKLSERIIKDLALRELDVQAREIEAQSALKIAEIGRWYEPEKLFAYVTLVFYGKVLIWDKVLALGSTDAVTGEVAHWAGAIMAFYFAKRGIENVARIVGNRFGGR